MSAQNPHVFISYAYEDKEDVAKPLVSKLQSLGINVWFDEISLKLGDNLVESIGKGLKDATYGIVIFSPSFFKKKWTQLELNALLELAKPGETKILPIRYNLSHEELARQQPLLSGVVSRSWDDGIEKLSNEIFDILSKKKKIDEISTSTPTFRSPDQNLDLFNDKLFEEERGDF